MFSTSKTVTAIKTLEVELEIIGVWKYPKFPILNESTTVPSCNVGRTSPMVISAICATVTNVTVLVKFQTLELAITE